MLDNKNSKVPTLNDAEFDDKITTTDKALLVDFWAPWCGPCQILSPMIEEIAEEFKDKTDFYTLNVDDNPNVSGNYGIMSIPTVIVFQGGEVKETFIGVQPKDVYVEALKKYMDK